jgi:hypothetical protein
MTPKERLDSYVMSKTFRNTTVTVLAAAVAVLVLLVFTVPGTGHGNAPTKKGVARTPGVTRLTASGVTRLTSSKPSSVAVVSGVLGFHGGTALPSPPPRCECTPAAGTVRLTNAHGHRIYVKTTKSGAFSVRVPAGRYRVVAGVNPPYHWPMGSCTELSGDGVHFDRSKHVSYLTVGHEKRMTIYPGCIA